MTRNSDAPAGREKGQKRGRESHDRIVEAAIRLLSRHGAPGVTHRAVADEAGVSLALTTYHFKSKEDILRKVYQRLSEGEVERFRAIYRPSVAHGQSPDELIDHIATQMIREATEFKDQSIAGCELMIEAFRSKELTPAVKKVVEEKLAFWTKTMTALGSPTPEIDAKIMICSALGGYLIMMARGQVQSEISRTRKKIEHDFNSLLPELRPSS